MELTELKLDAVERDDAELLTVMGSVWDPVLIEVELPVDVVNVFDPPVLAVTEPLVSPVDSPEEALAAVDTLDVVSEVDGVAVNDADPEADAGDWLSEPVTEAW